MHTPRPYRSYESKLVSLIGPSVAKVAAKPVVSGDIVGVAALPHALPSSSIFPCRKAIMADDAMASVEGRSRPRDADGRRLLGACDCGDLETVQRVLMSTDPNAETCVDVHGRGPLHIACARNEPRCVFLLLSHGADPTKKDAYGDSPADWARSVPGHDAQLADAVDLATRDRAKALQLIEPMCEL